MKTTRLFLGSFVCLCTLLLSSVALAAPDAPPADTLKKAFNQEAATALKKASDPEAATMMLQRITAIEKDTALGADEKAKQIANLLAEAVEILGDRTSAVLTLVTKQLSDELLASILVRWIEAIEAEPLSAEAEKSAIASLTTEMADILVPRPGSKGM